MWTEKIDQLVDQIQPDMVALRRALHRQPELSGQEFATSETICRRLREAGLPAELGPHKRGVLVDGPASAAPRFALRGDIDALPIDDIKLTDYASQTAGVMHACGHDAHSAIVYGAVRTLHAAEQQQLLPWPVCWRGIFQPAEETNEGALEMIEAGAVKDVHAIAALHVDPSRSVGSIGVREGAFTAACDEVQVTFEGRGGHAARPHETLDPIAAAAHFIQTVYSLVPRHVNSLEPVVITFAHIEGGHAGNVIPSRVILNGTLRTLGGNVREQTKIRISQIARAAADATHVRINVEFGLGPESVRNDPGMTGLFRRVGTDLLGKEHVEEIAHSSMGGEDFAHYLLRVPGAMFRLGITSPEFGGDSLHSPGFDIDERALAVGAKMLVRTLIEWSNPKR